MDAALLPLLSEGEQVFLRTRKRLLEVEVSEVRRHTVVVRLWRGLNGYIDIEVPPSRLDVNPR